MKYRHVDNIVYAPKEDGSIVLTDIEDNDGTFFKLSDVSKDIWLLIEEGLNVEELHERLSQMYEPYDDNSKSKVDGFIQDLLNRKFIEEDK